MTSSLANGGVGTCWICQQEDVRAALIGPCACIGSVEWVHRSCLDGWRASVDHPDAFYRCGICHQDFEMEVRDAPLADCLDRTRFGFFVTRDLIGACALLQLMVLGVGFVMMAIDWAAASCLPQCQPGYWLPAPLGGGNGSLSQGQGCVACPPIRATLFEWQYKEHVAPPLADYYAIGWLFFLAGIGLAFLGCSADPPAPVNSYRAHYVSKPQSSTPFTSGSRPPIQVIMYRESSYHHHRGRDRVDPDCCLCCDCRGVNCDCSRCGDAQGCKCDAPAGGGGGGGGGDECLAFFFLLVVMMAIALAAVGIFVGLVKGMGFVSRVVERHWAHLKLATSTDKFRVVDVARRREAMLVQLAIV